MCFNYKVSLFTFILGVIFSVLLIKTENIENQVTGFFMIFISFIQFMDFLFWIDINNKIGINKITTILGPILNVCQPTILYLIKYFFYKPDIFNFVGLLNLLYFIYFIIIYITFLSNDKLITTIKHNHLSWAWLKYYNIFFYLFVFSVNIFYLFDFKYALILFSLIYLFLFISAIYFKYNVGELWCFFGAFIPLIMYLVSMLITRI
jgi:hypothetical protein